MLGEKGGATPLLLHPHLYRTIECTWNIQGMCMFKGGGEVVLTLKVY